MTFAESVLSFVPSGFESYVRVFHPASLDGRPVTWADIAVANGKRAHAGMQLNALTGLDDRDVQPDVFDWSPEEGSLPCNLIPPLLETLSRHTQTTDRCWFAVWYGFGALRPELRLGPTFATPGREYFKGPIEGALESFCEYPQSANIWWPDDHAWCIATEIDLRTTYIGCSEACSDDLLARPELEAYEIDPSCGIDWRSDTLNPF
jgi:hypothetical protein